MADVNPTAAAMLGMLHDGPQSGWDLARRAELTIGDFWRVTQSQVYRELNGLAARGLVSMGEPGPRDRRTYRLTAAGRRAFASWLNEEPGPEQIRMPLLLTMHFGSRIGRERVLQIVERHREVHLERLNTYEQLRDSADGAQLDRYVLATLDFGLTYERAVLDWIDRLPEILPDEPPQE